MDADRRNKLTTALKIIGAVAGILGASGGSYIQARSESRQDADITYQTLRTQVTNLEEATAYLIAELDILKAREILKEHDLPPETMAELEKLLGVAGTEPFQPRPAEPTGRRLSRRAGGGGERAPQEGPAAEAEPETAALIEAATVQLRQAYDAKNRVSKPDWLDESNKMPELPATLDEAAQQRIWTK
jgi:hypothetical protein